MQLLDWVDQHHNMHMLAWHGCSVPLISTDCIIQLADVAEKALIQAKITLVTLCVGQAPESNTV